MNKKGLPDGWKEVKLGNIVILNYGKGLTANKRINGEIPVYSSSGLTGWHNKALIHEMGIIVGRKGTVGSVHFSNKPFYCIDTAYYITKNDTKEDLIYLFYLLKYLPLNKLNTDSAVPGLNRNNAYSQRLSLPPLPEQQKIAEILSSLDDKIELNNQMNKNLENMAQTIFKHWFVDFEFPDENGKPYASNGGKFVDSEMGLIPEGWRVEILGDVIEISSGKRPKNKENKKSKNYNIPIAGASKIMGFTSKSLYNKKLLIIGRVGTHGIIQKFNGEVWPSDNTLVITSKFYEFVYQILQKINYKSLNIGSTQPLITQTSIKNIKIIYSNEKELLSFESLVKNINTKIIENKKENSNLIKTRDSLLPKLMSGEIRVGDMGE